MSKPIIQHFFHAQTGTFTYVVADSETNIAAVIDPVLDFDYSSGQISFEQLSEVINHLDENSYKLEWILETHAHADHLTGAKFLQEKLGGKIAIGKGIRSVQKTFKTIFNFDDDFKTDGSQFDQLFSDNEKFNIGSIQATVINTPGHTSDSVTYFIGNNAFVGDVIFMPEYGTGRCDFPGGSAELLYDSIQKIYQLPNDIRLFTGHDYPKNNNPARCESTVLEQKTNNIHLKAKTTKQEFGALRQGRDKQLNMPKLIIPAIQVNIGGGKLPEPEDNEVSYLKIPLNKF